MPSAIDYMNNYKGDGKPNPIIPIIGGAFGTITPCVLYLLLNGSITPKNEHANGSSSTSTMMKIDNIMILLQSMSLTSLLFLYEFINGVIIRSKSIKGGFSPAAIQASNQQPYEIIETNRIHQNQIESACIYIPASVSAVAAGANITVVVSTNITWVIARVLYRFGYSQHSNPLWRLVGTVSSLTQSFICLGLFVHAKYYDK